MSLWKSLSIDSIFDQSNDKRTVKREKYVFAHFDCRSSKFVAGKQVISRGEGAEFWSLCEYLLNILSFQQFIAFNRFASFFVNTNRSVFMFSTILRHDRRYVERRYDTYILKRRITWA